MVASSARRRRRHLVPAGHSVASGRRERRRISPARDARRRDRQVAAVELGDPEGDKRSSIDLEVDEIGSPLTFAIAKVTKATRSTKTSGNLDDRWTSANREPATAGATGGSNGPGAGEPWTKSRGDEPRF